MDLDVASLTTWRSRTPSSMKFEGAHVGIHKHRILALIQLLSHYPWIVYLGFSFWRKMLWYHYLSFREQGFGREDLFVSLEPLVDVSARMAARYHGISGNLPLALETLAPRDRSNGESSFPSNLVRPLTLSTLIAKNCYDLAEFFQWCRMSQQKDLISWMITELQITWDVHDDRVEEILLPFVTLCSTLVAEDFKAARQRDDDVEVARQINRWGMLLTNGGGQPLLSRDQVLLCGDFQVVRNFITQVQQQQDEKNNSSKDVVGESPEVLQAVAFFFTQFAKIKEYLPVHFYVDEGVIPILMKLLHHREPEVHQEAAWALSYISDGDTRIQPLVAANNTEVIQRCAELIKSAHINVLIPALRVICNLCSGDDDITSMVLQIEKFEQIPALLGNVNVKVRKEVCWLLGNIAGGTDDHVEWLLKSGYLPHCTAALSQEFTVRKEAIWIVKNVMDVATGEQLAYLIDDCQFLPPFLATLDVPDKKMVRPVMDSLSILLSGGHRESVLQLLLQQNVDQKLRGLCVHDDPEVVKNAGELLELLDDKNTTSGTTTPSSSNVLDEDDDNESEGAG